MIKVTGTSGTDWLHILSTAGPSLAQQKIKQPLLGHSIQAYPLCLPWLPWVQTMGLWCLLKSSLFPTQQNPNEASQETTPEHTHAHCLQGEFQHGLGILS